MFELILNRLRGKRILILGFGREGRSTFAFLNKYLPDAVVAIVKGDVDKAISGVQTELTKQIDAFQKEVDAAAVYVNASTRFTDGFEFGFGAEIGISTQKLHARGPMGLRELNAYKYIGRGSGQTR